MSQDSSEILKGLENALIERSSLLRKIQWQIWAGSLTFLSLLLFCILFLFWLIITKNAAFTILFENPMYFSSMLVTAFAAAGVAFCVSDWTIKKYKRAKRLETALERAEAVIKDCREALGGISESGEMSKEVLDHFEAARKARWQLLLI